MKRQTVTRITWALVFGATLPACGARSEFELATSSQGELVVDGGRDARPDAAPDAHKILDASRDAMTCPDVEAGTGTMTCPTHEPKRGAACWTYNVQCAYVTMPDSFPDGLVGWCCSPDVGWYDCSGQICWCSNAAINTDRCYDVLCTPGYETECVVGNATQCCTCSSDGTADKCAPCPLEDGGFAPDGGIDEAGLD